MRWTAQGVKNLRRTARNAKRKVKKFIRHGDRDERLVNFLICGTQKGGTTTLNCYLREHPEICVAEKKEVHFFDDEAYFRGKTPDYAEYHSFFSPQSRHRLVGESTPEYMYFHDAPRRIWEYNPDMKIIVVLRNPIERAYSHWNMEYSRKMETLPFWDAIRSEPERCRQVLPLQHRFHSYIDRGFYLEQLRRLWFYFSKQRVLALKSEYLRDHPADALGEICEFLGVAPYERIVPKTLHARSYVSKMDERERDYLRYVFEHEIRGLERALGWDCSNWLAAG